MDAAQLQSFEAACQGLHVSAWLKQPRENGHLRMQLMRLKGCGSAAIARPTPRLGLRRTLRPQRVAPRSRRCWSSGAAAAWNSAWLCCSSRVRRQRSSRQAGVVEF